MCETRNEALCRKQIDKLSKKRVRMCETEDEALCRKQINKLSMKKVRMCETRNEALCRKQIDKLSKKTKRALSVTVENAICSFLSKIKVVLNMYVLFVIDYCINHLL